MELRYSFEELKLPKFGDGMLLTGEALLKHDCDGEFYVASIRLAGMDSNLPRYSRVASNSFDQELYREIEAVLYDDKSADGLAAAQAWSDEVCGLLSSRLGHNSAARLERAYGGRQ